VLAGRSLEIAWIESSVDAFFIEIQGSARLRLEDGSVVRVGYAGKNGHPYTAIGRVLVERGELPRSGVSMQAIRDWLGRQSPERAQALMNENRSYVFFRIVDGLDPTLGPVGAQTVPLTAGRSIAVDWRLHAYGTPFWVDTLVPEAPGAQPTAFRRLMVAQDTGGAIVGPARIDLFLGSGDQAGSIAGGVRAPVRLYLLWPKRTRK
jgi:membrane-bound lytic murein transglycosylase A